MIAARAGSCSVGSPTTAVASCRACGWLPSIAISSAAIATPRDVEYTLIILASRRVYLTELNDQSCPVIASFGGSGLGLAFAVALLLGARHATDPDHLTAVSALILSDDARGGRRAGLLGLFWGLGHATTLFLFGLPVVLFGRSLPDSVQRTAEAVVGLVIVGLAVRLLVRWQRGYFHSHRHQHGAISHVHPHAHEDRQTTPHPARHGHTHAESLGRSPLASFSIGLVHGAGG